MHVYIIGDCKTTNCGTALVLTYLGERGTTPASVEYWMSYPVDDRMIDCPTCGKTYDYSHSQDKFHKKSFHLVTPANEPADFL